ncbi:MAG TPA: efflux RND transporter periplasmic adaptor subunit [Pyrinomonadaceae bacterium]|jgi:RND family efflux transporter, MFP subunit|nr:efflux RND transporter periplasmic adaptor subunit [Pyrinomonadaceae bacterium]
MRGILILLLGNVRKHKVLALTVGVAMLLCVVGLVVVGRTKKPVEEAPQPLAVEVSQVEQKDVPIYSEWIGTTEGMVNADVRAQVSGYLLKKDYTEGALVKQGQLLFEIDTRPFQAALAQAQGDLAKSQGQLSQANAQLEQAQANLAQANSQLLQARAQLSQSEANQRKTELDVNKYTPLAQKKAVTQQDLDNAVQSNLAAKAQVEASKAGIETAQAQIKAVIAAVSTAKAAIVSAQAQVQSSQAAVKTAELNLGFTRITSLIEGIAGIAQAQVGDLVSPTSGIITTVSTLDPVKVYFTISEQEYLAFLDRYGTSAERDGALQNLELELFLADGKAYPQKGKFFVADRQVDQKTGAIRLAGIFANPGNALRPGQYARVRAAMNTQKDALLVPQRAVTELQGTHRVAVVGADNKVSIRSVTLGPQSESSWIIHDGLKAGETVVVMGAQRLTPGQVVKPKPFTGTEQ